MYSPNGFVPSSAIRRREYDEEGRLRETRIGPGAHTDGDSGIAESNSLYATDAEYFGAITPFLKKNRIRDAKRRNYVIQPGGACLYFSEDKAPEDAFGGGKVVFDAPGEKDSFGHNSLPGGHGAGQNGRRFSLSSEGSKSGGT
jgi:hypothetical protein